LSSLVHLPIRLSCYDFRRCGYPRDLRSFPTRRSSDLRARGIIAADAPRTSSGSRYPAAPGAPFVVSAHATSPPSATTALSAAPEDRKSTRLNSSHVSISYAVFCLKKKKITIKLKDVKS